MGGWVDGWMGGWVDGWIRHSSKVLTYLLLSLIILETSDGFFKKTPKDDQPRGIFSTQLSVPESNQCVTDFSIPPSNHICVKCLGGGSCHLVAIKQLL
jgi:hypothetical protein